SRPTLHLIRSIISEIFQPRKTRTTRNTQQFAPKQLKDMIEIYQRAGDKARRDAPRSRVRVARMVYVTD
ncbi:MAG: hypothetical protein ACXW6K_25560, partial [Candidatus Binatia bacterium]